MEQELIKRIISEKNVVDKSLQTDSKVSIFRRKEIMDESEQTNISARTSSVTPFKKQLQPNSPQLQDQESYCNNQQPVAYQPLQTPKSFQEGFEQEIIFPEKTKIKKTCMQESGYATEQVEKHDSQQIKTQVSHLCSQDLNRLESPHSNEQAICVQNLPSKTFSQEQPLNEADLMKERTLISERTSQRISSYQQTSIAWGPETLAELLLPFHQSMINNSEKETLHTETLLTFSGASEMKPVLQESQHSTQQLQWQELEQISQRDIVQESWHCIQPPDGQESRNSQSVTVQESQHSIQQPEEQESRRDSQSVAVQDSWHGIQQPEGQESRRGSCSVIVQESQHSIQQPEGQESRRGSRSVAVQESWHGIQQPEGQESRQGSQSIAIQESQHHIKKLRGQESRKASQQAAVQESQHSNQKSEGQESRRGSRSLAVQESRRNIQKLQGQESKQDSQQTAVPESQYNIQEPKISRVWQETQLRGQQVESEKTKSEEQKIKRRRKIRKIKIDQAQQTDSAQSLKRELLEKGLQTDTVSIAKIRTQLGMQESHHGSHQYDLQKADKPVISDLCTDSLPEKGQDFGQGSKPVDITEFRSSSLPANLPDSLYDSQQTEVQEFRHNSFPQEDRQVRHSRPSAGLKEFEYDSHQFKKKDNQSDMLFELKQKSQHGSLGTENKIDDAKEPLVTITSENRTVPLKQKMSFGQQTYSIISLEETTWLNRRSGKLMQNQSQQTNDSWLQNYREKKQKLASKEALSKSNESGVQKSQRISSESETNEQYTAFEIKISREQGAVLESHENSKHYPSLESQRSSKQLISLETQKASELPAKTDSWEGKQSFVPESQTNSEQKVGGQVTIPEYQRDNNKCMISEFGKGRQVSAAPEFQKGSEEPTLSESPKVTEYPTPPNSQRSSEETVFPVSERFSEKCTVSESLRAIEEPESQITNESPNIQLHRTSEQPFGSESKTSELFSEKWETSGPSLIKSQGIEFSNMPHSRRVSAPPSILQSLNSNELPNLPQSRRASETLISQTITESHLVYGFQKANLLPVSESQRDSEQALFPEPQIGSEYPPLLDFLKGSGQSAIPEPSECNEQPICPESQKFGEPAVSESQNNGEQPTIPEFQRDSDHPYELEFPKGSEQLTVSESQRDSKQPAIPESQRNTESVRESRCRRDSVKLDTSESQRFTESLIMLKSQTDSEQTIMPESWSVSQQSITLLPEWESKQPAVVEAELQLVADKVNKVAGDNTLESVINNSKQKSSFASKAQQTYSIISVGMNTWKNRRTGKIMTCSSQQTERSWLQEHRARKVNLTSKESFSRNSMPEEKKTEFDKIHRVDDDRKKIVAQQDTCKDESQPENQMAAAAALIKEKELISFEGNEAEKELQESYKDEPTVGNQQEKLLQSQRGSLQEDALIDGVPKPELLASQQSGQEVVMVASKVAEVVKYCQPSQHADLPFQHASQQPEVTTSQPASQQTEIAASKQVSQQAVLTSSQQASQEAEVPASPKASQQTEISQNESKQAEVPASRQASQQIDTSQQAEDISPQQASQQQEIMASGQEEGMTLQITSKLDVEQELHQGSKQSVKHEFHYNDILWSTPSSDAQQSYESASRSTLDSSSSYVEGEDEALQTYSRISLENDFWLNRKTGKLLINHGQQTSMSLLSKTALENNRNSAGCPKAPISDVKLSEAKFGQETCSSNKPSEIAVSDLSIQPSWDEVQSIDEVEQVLVSHVSRNMLSAQSLAYIEVEYETALTYDSLSMPKGSWINLKTGKVLASHYQQTDESSFEKPKEDIQSVRHPSYTPELSYYDLSDRPINESSQQSYSDAHMESEMPDG
ncbi:uncharacterized protein LOC120301816 [Crotalus tigris]|uniref:uncharacterized protein LOC120301816 n=1 Tax=Crotalus tigris TaxID=88082 RepID=UPI00192F2CF5|nr:uncharacterized protein LOC120301816 [Crotalus tigris]